MNNRLGAYELALRDQEISLGALQQLLHLAILTLDVRDDVTYAQYVPTSHEIYTPPARPRLLTGLTIPVGYVGLAGHPHYPSYRSTPERHSSASTSAARLASFTASSKSFSSPAVGPPSL